MGTFDTETVVITRRAASTPGSFTTSTVFSGACDFQSGGGSEYINPAGAVDVTDGFISLDPAPDGSLPDVKVGDKATVDGVDYNVVNIAKWNFPLPHLELSLKRGTIESKPHVR